MFYQVRVDDSIAPMLVSAKVEKKAPEQTTQLNKICLFFLILQKINLALSCVRETQRKIEEGITWSPW